MESITMDSNLLKEAIADAKAVRQTALANAKAALEESFGRRLEAMFQPQLEEETSDIDPNAVATSAPAPSPVLAPEDQEGAINEADIEEIIRELEAGIPNENPQAPVVPPAPTGDPAAMASQVPQAPQDATGVCPPVGAPGVGTGLPTDPNIAPQAPQAPAPAPAVNDEASPELDEEINIDELLESLKANVDDDEAEENECINESVPVNTSGIGSGSDNKAPSSDASKSSGIESSGKSVKSANVGTPEYKQIAADPSTATRPNQAKNATKTNLSTPGGKKIDENTGGSTPGYPEQAKKTSKGKDPSEAQRPNQAPHATKDNLETVPSPLKEENQKLKTQLSEATETLIYLRQQLNEINLLNAKLLYTNRLFREYSMDNNKKMKIVEMFDLTKNVREVKMTYAVIAESLNFGADFKRKTKVQNITEGMASQPIAGTAPRQIIAESAKSQMVQNFQRLAGITATKQQPKTK